jgi:hypothetical protein
VQQLFIVALLYYFGVFSSRMSKYLPSELLDDVRTKFLRYSSEVDGVKELSAQGLRYLIKSCPSGPLGALQESKSEEYFLAAAGPGSNKRRCVRAAPLTIEL